MVTWLIVLEELILTISLLKEKVRYFLILSFLLVVSSHLPIPSLSIYLVIFYIVIAIKENISFKFGLVGVNSKWRAI